MSHIRTATPWSAILGGFVAVALFSLTMPLMRIAVGELDATFVGVGRMLLSVLPACIVLTCVGWPRLSWGQLGRLAIVTACLVFGFAWLTAHALKTVPSHHAAIVTGGIPLATALAATFTGGWKPSWRFWAAATIGSMLVAGYGVMKSGGALSLADLLLLTAALVCGIGYSEGVRLTAEVGAIRMTCLMPLMALPGALELCWGKWPTVWSDVHAVTWLAFLYNGLVSAFGAFFFWYPALRRGGAARIGQIQLIQPFLTLASSAWMLGEKLALADWLVAAAVVGCVAVAQRARGAAKSPASVAEEPVADLATEAAPR
jgi:drug/metabolite transporter (DMT)-like permease